MPRSHPLYDDIGRGYHQYRQPDPRIKATIHGHISGSCLNVGAGAGAYEPHDTIACELSLTMINQRAGDAAPAVQASATRLPFPDNAFDTSLALLTVHHWDDPDSGIHELRRVSRERVIVLTFDNADHGFWLTDDYFPAIVANDRTDLSYASIVKQLSPQKVITVPIPHDCTDGFLAAYWRRPHAYLDPAVRNAISAFHKLDAHQLEAGLTRLERDLSSGVWEERYGALQHEQHRDYGYRLLVADSRTHT